MWDPGQSLSGDGMFIVVPISDLRFPTRIPASTSYPLASFIPTRIGDIHSLVGLKLLDLVVALVAIHALMKNVERKELHHLRENNFSGIHRHAPKEFFSKDGASAGKISS
jgi:hypothetical protein